MERLVKIWLDDERPAPSGWIWMRRIHQVMHALRDHAEYIDDLSLDHDLGIQDPILFERYTFGELTEEEAEENGYTLCKWMAEHNIWPSGDIHLHTDNPVGRHDMAMTIEHHGPYRAHPDGRTFSRV